MGITRLWVRRCIVGLILLSATALSSIPRVPAASSPRSFAGQPASSDSLSAKDRIKAFEEVWRTIDEKYYDPRFNGVNWQNIHDRYRPLVDRVEGDDDFYAMLKRMVGELHDAHTRFHTPRERRERKKQQTVTVGIAIFEVEGRPTIVAVDPNSQAARQGVEAGMTLRSVGGTPIADWLAANTARVEGTSSERATRLRLYYRIIDGEPGSSFKVELARADGTLLEVTLVRRIVSEAPAATWRRLASGFGYIKLNVWESPIHKEFKRALERLTDAPGLIIDLRGNPGGEVDEVLRIAEHFFTKRTSFGKFVSRSGRALQLFAGEENEDEVYSGAVAILVNESSGSGSEMFAGVLQENGRAVVVGRQSCGCLLGIAKFREVEGGGELAVSELAYLSPKGRKLEGRGVIPDEPVALTIADLQRHRDAALEVAENVLRTPTLKTSTVAR